jgi:hypothetical protein
VNWFTLALLPFAAVGALRVYYAVSEGLGIYSLSRRASRAEMMVQMAIKLCDGNRDQATLVLAAAADQIGRNAGDNDQERRK